MNAPTRPRTDEILGAISKLDPETIHRHLTDEEMANDALMGGLRRDAETFQKARKAIEALANIVNGMGNNKILRSAIVAEILRTHRYLQGELIFTLLYALGDLAALDAENPGHWTDGRNSYAYEALQKIKERSEIYFGD